MTRREHHIHCAEQGFTPLRNRSDRRGLPVKRSNAFRHFTGSDEMAGLVRRIRNSKLSPHADQSLSL